MDSIIALHGPVIYSTERGRELIERALAFEQRKLDVAAFKPVAIELAEAIDKVPKAVTELARETLKEASADIGEGRHPDRSTEVAHTNLANFMAVAAKSVQKAFTN
jgi:hypothetical protein